VSGTLFAAKRVPDTLFSEYRQELLEEIHGHPNVEALTGNPLMLTVLAVVHWSRKKLPEQRAELYHEAVDVLLESRERVSEIPNPLRKRRLQAVALRMFEDPAGMRRTLDRERAAAATAPLLGGDAERAVAFLEDEELHSGILVSRGRGQVEFWHLTFQEYLAALEIASMTDYWGEIEPHMHKDQWSEVVLLLAGCLCRNRPTEARTLIEKILQGAADLPAKARAVGLIGRVLRDTLSYGEDFSAGTDYAEVCEQTLAIFEPGGEEVGEETRVEVGEALGQAGDPRLEEENLVRIPGGTFPVAGVWFSS